jgi:Flp pilus assembly protein TadG
MTMLVDRIRSRTRRQDGAVAVELMVVAPILIVILFAIVQFGLIWAALENYVSAAREGARYAAVRCEPDSSTGCTNALIATRVTNASTMALSGSPTANITCTSSTIGQLVTVSWSQNLSYSIPFFGSQTYSKTIQAAFRCE